MMFRRWNFRLDLDTNIQYRFPRHFDHLLDNTFPNVQFLF